MFGDQLNGVAFSRASDPDIKMYKHPSQNVKNLNQQSIGNVFEGI